MTQIITDKSQIQDLKRQTLFTKRVLEKITTIQVHPVNEDVMRRFPPRAAKKILWGLITVRPYHAGGWIHRTTDLYYGFRSEDYINNSSDYFFADEDSIIVNEVGTVRIETTETYYVFRSTSNEVIAEILKTFRDVLPGSITIEY